jgi:alpha,alpha-trehalase
MLPRFDAPAVFARILDADGGHFAIRPAGDFRATRAYIDQTMALETTFRADVGIAVLIDAMAVGRNDRGHDLGAGSPGVLMRRLQCTQGTLDVDVTYAPRPDYGLIYPILQAVNRGIAARGGASRLLLSAPPGFQVAGASGGLARRMVLPAFYQLAREGLLPGQWLLVGNSGQRPSQLPHGATMVVDGGMSLYPKFA